MSGRQRNSEASASDGIGLRMAIASALLVATLVFLLVWARSFAIAGAVVASGELRLDQNIVEIGHSRGGTISAVHVHRGDAVSAGDLLFELDSASASAERSVLLSSYYDALGRRARLVAESGGQTTLIWPDGIAADDTRMMHLIQIETQILTGAALSRANRKVLLDLTVAQVVKELEGLSAEQNALLKEAELARSGVLRLRDLAGRGLVDTAQVEIAERDIARVEGSIGALESTSARVMSRISEIELRKVEIDDLARETALAGLAEIEARLAELQERLAAADVEIAQSRILAPASGTISEILFGAVGQVVRPADSIARIAVSDPVLDIEVRIRPLDIDSVYLGQAAEVRFSTLNRQRTPVLKGYVSWVAPASTVDERTGLGYFAAEIEVAQDDMELIGESALLPGLPVEIHIQTASIRALDYFLKPLTDQFSRALREE